MAGAEWGTGVRTGSSRKKNSRRMVERINSRWKVEKQKTPEQKLGNEGNIKGKLSIKEVIQ